MTPEKAIVFIRRAPEVPGWGGDVAVGIPFDPKAVSYTYRDGSSPLCPPRQDLPVRRVPVAALVASQPTVSRQYMIELLQLAALGAMEVPPILVLQRPGSIFWIQDGHHRAYAGMLLGSRTVEAWLRPSLEDCPS